MTQDDEDEDDEVVIVDERRHDRSAKDRTEGYGDASTVLLPASDSAAARQSTAAISRPPSTGAINWAPRGQGSWQQMSCPVCGLKCDAAKHGPDDPPAQDSDEGAPDRLLASHSQAKQGDGSGAGGRNCIAHDERALGNRDSGTTLHGRSADGSLPVAAPASACEAASSATQTAHVIDLTLSSDEEMTSEDQRGQMLPSAIALGARATKRARPVAAVNRAPATARSASSANTTLLTTKPCDDLATWRCNRCTFLNTGSGPTCEMACGEPAPGSWQCVKCSLLNAKNTSGCIACGTWRYSRDIT